MWRKDVTLFSPVIFTCKCILRTFVHVLRFLTFLQCFEVCFVSWFVIRPSTDAIIVHIHELMVWNSCLFSYRMRYNVMRTNSTSLSKVQWATHMRIISVKAYTSPWVLHFDRFVSIAKPVYLYVTLLKN